MSHDFYAYYQTKDKQDFDQLANGSEKYDDIVDTYQRVLLLSTAYYKSNIVNHAKSV